MYWSQMESPLGVLTLLASEKGLCTLSFGSELRAPAWIENTSIKKDEIRLVLYKQQIMEYLEGEREYFTLPLDVRVGTPFQRKVWEELQSIPYGKVKSYKDVAIAINHPKAARAVGSANNKNPLPILIPCHRVIGANGALVGFGGGISVKQELLRREGYRI